MTEDVILPFVLVNIDATLSDEQLRDKLKEVMLSLGTHISGEPSQNSFCVVKKEKNVFKNFCQAFWNNKNELTTIQITIKFLENRYDRLVELKEITGSQIDGENLILNFLKKFTKISKDIKIIRKAEGYFNSLETTLNNSFSEQNHEINKKIGSNYINENATMLETINKEATNYYEIYKILTQENYELGKSVTIFINDFKIKNNDIEQSKNLLPQQMKEIISMINSCEDTFNNYFNKNGAENTYKFAKPAIEKFIFNKLYFQLYDLYSSKYDEDNKKYLAKKELINEKLSIEKIMEYLEVKEPFKCLNEYEKSKKSENSKPYKSTIDYVNKMEYEQNPKIKFDTILGAGLDLRNTILGNNNGKCELKSMDDELPIYIYICTQINIKNICAELHIIEDYLLNAFPEEEESKVLRNMMSAVLFISNDDFNLK